jgi:predicted PurR-regulated permease PerM
VRERQDSSSGISLLAQVLVKPLLNLHSRFLIKSSLLDKRISLAIAFLIISCIGGVAAALVWQSSRQVISVPQAAAAPVALSQTLEQQLEAMSSGLPAVQQSVDELSSGLGQMRRDITNLQTTEQALLDKISEPPRRPAAAPPARATPPACQSSKPAR